MERKDTNQLSTFSSLVWLGKSIRTKLGLVGSPKYRPIDDSNPERIQSMAQTQLTAFTWWKAYEHRAIS